LQAKRDAVVLMSVSVPRRGAARGYPVRSCWPRRRGSRSAGRWIWTAMLTQHAPRRHVRALASARRRRSGRQPV